MIDSIFVALSGMKAHERGLNVISSNIANMNTPGFRGSSVSFSDVFLPSGWQNGSFGSLGAGVDFSRTRLDMHLVDPQQTGRELDVALQGEGFFVIQDESGSIRYTRDGRFDFNDDGELLASDGKSKVMTRVNGQLVPVSIKDLQVNPPKATTKVSYSGILSSDDLDEKFTIETLTVFDKDGGKHTLKVEFARQDDNDPTNPGNGISKTWTMTLFEGTEEVGHGDIAFDSFDPQESTLHLTLQLKNATAEIDFALNDLQGGNFGNNTNVTVKDQDGFASGTLTAKTFDAKGVLKLTYSNNQKADGATLVLARIPSDDGLVQIGDSLFEYKGTRPVELREADDNLKVASQSLEPSNVDLTQQFSVLILMQRGYQASSQVISTANDMLQQLFDMRGRG